MPIPILCPSCGRSGKLPDTFPGGVVKCPACGVSSTIARPASKSAPTAKPPKPRPLSEPIPAGLFDDVEDVEDSPDRHEPAALPRSRSYQTQAPSGSSLPLLLGAGGGIALVLALVTVLFFRQSGGEGPSAPTIVQAPPAQAEPTDPTPVALNPTRSSFAAPGSPAFKPPTESVAATIQRIKSATVYIKVKLGEVGGSGSGFVIGSLGDATLIATNRHVIDPSLEEDDAEVPAGTKPELSVVFHSGEGASVEQQLPAEIIAADVAHVTSRDLAILAVRGVHSPPRPIDLNRSAEPSEGTELRIYGFPFGEILNIAAREGSNPAITVSKGSVSSLRRDDRGHLALIQLDGSVQPGNSGGPVVDEQGFLVGVTVAKLRLADNFGLAVPAAHLQELLAGRVGDVELVLASAPSGQLQLNAKAVLADPFDKVRAVSLKVMPAPPTPVGDDATAAPALGIDAFAAVPGADLAIDRGTRTASGPVVAAINGQTPDQVLISVTFTNGSGDTYITEPMPYRLPRDVGGKLVALGDGSNEAEMAEESRKSVARLGTLQDPAGDCKLEKAEKAVKITVPGTLHTLAPQLKDKAGKAVKNAPMAVTEVKGDFVAHVRVGGDIRPGADPTTDPRGKRLPITYQGAGLVLWQDQDNYVRLERGKGTAGGTSLVSRILVEVCADGLEAEPPYYIDVADGPISVMILRAEGRVMCLFQEEGSEKWKVFRPLGTRFPEQVKVGVVAVNISKKPFTAELEDFVLIEDPKRVRRYNQP